jgi:crossover junction endodeoxyribonuclease RuvC
MMSIQSIRMPKSKSVSKEAIILGIDPGYADMGYGFIRVQDGTNVYIHCGSITTSSKLPIPDRLAALYHELTTLVLKYRPTLFAIEKLFFFKNVTNALDVAQARGIALLVAAEHSLPVSEHTPLEIKQSLTSYGRADKKQVAHMVKTLLGKEVRATNDNALDALAIALCASFRYHITTLAKRSSTKSER